MKVGHSFLAVTRVLLVLLISGLVFVLGLPLALLRHPTRPRATAARHAGLLMRWCLSVLGPTFVKLGQIVSTRPDLLPAETVDELRKLQDRMQPADFARIQQAVEEDLGGPIGSRFREFDRRPVAAASIAQVHRAVLRDGTEVAVKVVRPDIIARIARDADALLTLVRVAEILPPVRSNGVRAHLLEFINAVSLQTDLAIEATNYRAFQANFRRKPEILFPRVYSEYSSRRVLTMGFIRGTKVDELPVARRTRAGRLIRQAFFKMCFEDAFVHADLHPGNMLLTDEGSLALFDVGLVKRLDDMFFFQFVDFTTCLTLRNADVFVGHFRQFHPYLEGRVRWDALREDLIRLLDKFAGQSNGELELSEFNRAIFTLFRKHGIRPVPEITMMLVATMTNEGVGKILEPASNQFEEIGDFILSSPAEKEIRQVS